MTHSLRGVVALLAATLGAAPAAAQQAAARDTARRTPALVVFVTIDQLAARHLDRFGHQLTGGLARLTRGGAWFTNAFQDHANTETAPGHSTTMSGRYPASTGILTNENGVEDTTTPRIGSGRTGASPRRFRGTTLFDWIRAADPRARALSVSRKDRSAILPIGRAREEVYWYDGSDGTFTTSTWYRDTLPAWVRRFNDRRLFHALVGRTWTPIVHDTLYDEADRNAWEKDGKDVAFPHAIGNDTATVFRRVTSFPWMDEITAQLALEGVTALRIGLGPGTDVLNLGLSTTDAIGHDYGPDSKELHDQILRVDRVLGAFIDSLYRLRDSSTIVLALTADHGIAPNTRLQSWLTGEVVTPVSMDTLEQKAHARMRAAGIAPAAFRLEDWMLFVERDAFARRPALADSLVREFADAARRVNGVARVDTPREIQRRAAADSTARRWSRMLAPDAPIELVVTLKPYFIRGGDFGAEHGSPWDYDAHVPVIFYGPWFRTGRFDERAAVVDMAPTLAQVVGVRPTERLDGRVLESALVRTPR